MYLMRAVLAVVAAVFLFLPAEASEVRRLVLAAGANNGGVDRELLRYAVTDAENFVEVMEEMGGLDPADVLLLRDPDRAAFVQGLAELRRRVEAAGRRGDRLEVLLYYSGHADEEGLLLAGDRLEYPLLRRALETAGADVRIAVLDACASGAITRLKGGRRRPSFLLDESFDMKGYAFLTSNSADEVAQESDLLQASFFTHYLVSGLRGAADGDGDGRVILNEVYEYTFNETRARTTGTVGGVQHPAYEVEMRGTGGVVMTEMSRNGAGLVLEEALAGRFYIRNVGQRLVAELDKPAGRAISLGLEPGAYSLYLQAEDASWRLAELNLVAEEFAPVKAAHFRALAPEQTRLHGGAGRGISLGLTEDLQFEVAASGRTVSLGLLTNTQDEAFRGAQLAWLVNLARERAGTQGSWVGNLAVKEVHGWQVAAVGVNWAIGPLQGWQAGLINIASQVRGWQLAGATNVAGRMRGWQVAGVASFADEVKGAQIGLLNVANEVKGWQVGLVNVSDNIRGGLPVGLVNYSRTGVLSLSAWRDEAGFTLFTLASGSRSFHTSFTIGFAGAPGGRRWALGAGGGMQKRGQRFFFGLDLHGYRISLDLDEDLEAGIEYWPLKVDLGLDRSRRGNYLSRLRLETGALLVKEGTFPGRPSLFAGVSLNQLWTGDHPRLIEPGSRWERKWKEGLFVWPGFFFGLRYGR